MAAVPDASKRTTRFLLILVLWTALAPFLAFNVAAGQERDGRCAVVFVDVHSMDECQNAGHCEDSARHHHSCAGHQLGVLDEGIRVFPAKSRDASLPEPSAGLLRIFLNRLDRPPLTPDLA